MQIIWRKEFQNPSLHLHRETQNFGEALFENAVAMPETSEHETKQLTHQNVP